MNPNLQNELNEFKAWYDQRLSFINKILIAAETSTNLDIMEIKQLRTKKLQLMENAAKMIVEIYSKYGYYKDL